MKLKNDRLHAWDSWTAIHKIDRSAVVDIIAEIRRLRRIYSDYDVNSALRSLKYWNSRRRESAGVLRSLSKGVSF